jgi:hypothetical protein
VALWRRERERALELAERARAAPIRTRLDEPDPFKLRFVLIVAVVGAFVIAGDDASNRLGARSCLIRVRCSATSRWRSKRGRRRRNTRTRRRSR